MWVGWVQEIAFIRVNLAKKKNGRVDVLDDFWPWQSYACLSSELVVCGIFESIPFFRCSVNAFSLFYGVLVRDISRREIDRRMK